MEKAIVEGPSALKSNYWLFFALVAIERKSLLRQTRPGQCIACLKPVSGQVR